MMKNNIMTNMFVLTVTVKLIVSLCDVADALTCVLQSMATFMTD